MSTKPIFRNVALWSLLCLLNVALFTACKHEAPVAPASTSGGDDDGGDDDGMAPDPTSIVR